MAGDNTRHFLFGAPGMARSAMNGAGEPVSESEPASDLEVKVLCRLT